MKVRPRTSVYKVVQWDPDNSCIAGEFARALAVAEIPFQITPDRTIRIWQGDMSYTLQDENYLVITGIGKCITLSETMLYTEYEEVLDSDDM